MKRSLSKQLMVSAFFVCSLSAHVPDAGRPPERAAADRWPNRVERKLGKADGLVASQAVARAFELHDDLAVRRLSPIVGCPSWAPPPMALALPAVWPGDGFDIYPMGRGGVRRIMFPSLSLVAINVPADPLDRALLVSRYRLSMAMPDSAWPCPDGAGLRASASSVAKAMADKLPGQVLRPTQSLNVAGLSVRADMAAMLPRLKKVFVEEGVPQQWIWMAEVESTFNPQAISSAGAAGLFQLMPGTARRFGLQTTPVDERMEPEKSAGAAAQYLKILHREFGSWSLALAAYNAGEGRVREIMKKRQARTFNEVAPYLPAETRSYVPKVMAIVALREDRLHGVRSAYWMP
ncbi:MAG: lytic transglycosylase domain-containing protein [Verrucomicrobiota bacterium]